MRPFLFKGGVMPEQKEGISFVIMTPQGPLHIGFSIERFTEFVSMLNSLLEQKVHKTPIPKVFEDALGKEKDNDNTD